MSLLGGIELAPLITKVKVDVKGFKSEMEQVKTEAVTKTKEVLKQMEKTIKVGESMSKLGGTLTKALTIPIAGAGIALGKLSMDMSENMGMVSTLLDGTTEQVQKRTNELKESVLRISDDTGVASSNIADGAYQVVSAFGDTADAAKILETAAKGAKASGATTTDTINLLSAVTKGYGDTSAEANQKASDLAFMTAKLGQTTFPELAGSIGKVVPLAENLKVSQEELFGVMATATGVTGNAAEVTTQFKGILQSLMAPTDSMTGLMKKLGYENGQAMMQSLGLQGTIDAITKAASDSGEPLQSYIGSIEGQTLALALSGAQHDTFTEKLKAMNDVAGATDEAFEKVNNTTGAKFKNSLNKAKNAAIKLGDALAPLLEKGANLIGTLAEKISSLSPEALDSIVKMGGMIAVAGPLLKVTGGLVKGYGKLKPLISGVTTLFSKGAPLVGKFAGKLAESSGLIGKVGGALTKLAPAASSALPALSGVASGATAVGGAAATAGGATGLGALASSLGGAAVAAAPFVAAGAAVVATGYGIYKCLSQEVVPEVDLFADGMVDTSIKITDAYGNTVSTVGKQTVKISEATQEAVQAYMDMDDAITQQMYEMKVGSTKITKEIADDMVGKFNQMGDSIITKQKETVNTSLHTLKTFYTETGGTVDAKEQAILDSITTKHNEQVANVEESKRRISEIYQRAADENREITQAEQTEINTIQENMRDTAITTFSETEQEAAVIRERMKDYQSRLSAEMASEMILKANEARDKEKQAAEDKYNGIVKEASKLKQAGLITDEQYKSMVDSAKTAKDEQIKRAEEACSGIKQEIQDATPGIENEVNMQTGSIMDTWDRMCNWVSDKFDWLTGKSEEAQRMAKNAENSGSKLESRTKRRNGSHYNGLDYVPFDGYNARLHEGERVLTKKENEQYTKGKQGIPGGGKIVIDVPISINDREFAHATKEAFFEEFGFDMG